MQNSPPIRVAPDTRYTAEVVVLLTTLGAKRTEFNAGKRARDLLEIKKVHHKIIDFNRDARQAGTGEAENLAIQKLMEKGKLQTGDNKDLSLPQIFIDGIYIGDATELQGLEDDQLLDSILVREACVKCNDKKRKPGAVQCESCWEKFEEILPGLMTIDQHLQELALMAGHDDYDDDYGDEDYLYDEPDYLAGASVGASSLQQNEQVSSGGYGGASSSAASKGSVPARPEQLPLAPTKTVPDEGFRESKAAPATKEETPQSTSAAAEPAPKPAIKPDASAVLATAQFKVGDEVNYWSDTKKRNIVAIVDGVRQKEGRVVYDLNCKKGAAADKLSPKEKS
eukprot:TRINITY_DN11634_c0_g1_i1.p1 TRINITY_DN11634_c0_g1~~TRINITY_DN11634_c0_g1_i1.p1  ORF type:complete len:339 (+),score=85.05 TRINITY_DN11634_c0_g1_i1:85-1101(+)